MTLQISSEATSSLAIENMTPRQIVAELDKYVVGQKQAKRAGAIPLANRWARRRLPPGRGEGGEGGRGHRPAQPLAPAAASARAGGGHRAQEHPDDRPHRRRQDRD